MLVVAGGIETVVEEFGEGERWRRSHVVHGLGKQKVITDGFFVAG